MSEFPWDVQHVVDEPHEPQLLEGQSLAHLTEIPTAAATKEA
jgi:hypothetical protein